LKRPETWLLNARVNERLRTAMLRAGVTTDELALCCGVDTKTVERWLSPGRAPHRRHRWAAARRLGCEDDYLWPDAPGEIPARRADATRAELVRLYPDRGSIPREMWQHLLSGAREHIGILVYAALFLAEDASARKLLAEQARAGVRVRLLLGDPDSPAVAQRGEEEGIGPDAIGAKIRNVLALFRPVLQAGAEIRLHGTVLYNSMYRADDDLLVNTHIHGYVATCAPVLHLRKIAGGGLVITYLDSFDRIWDKATPWTGS
jgi:transcriptional regulator with XRE-family HTH domain